MNFQASYQSAVPWEYGFSFSLGESTGSGEFLDDRMIIGVNVGAPHYFCYSDGSRLTRYAGILGHGEIQLTPPQIKHTAVWKNATFNLNHLDLNKVNTLIEGTELNSLQGLIEPTILIGNRYLTETCIELLGAIQQQSMTLYKECLLMAFFANYQSQVLGKRSPVAYRGLSRQDPRWLRVNNFIEENLQRKIPLGELAEVANLSKYHLSREYKRLFGESLSEGMKRRRLEKAANLLKSSLAPLSEVAKQVGFTSLAHFSRSFKAYFGVSASDYRKQ